MIANYRLIQATPQELLNDFSALLASFINCGTTNELEYDEYTTVPPLKKVLVIDHTKALSITLMLNDF